MPQVILQIAKRIHPGMSVSMHTEDYVPITGQLKLWRVNVGERSDDLHILTADGCTGVAVTRAGTADEGWTPFNYPDL